MWHHVKLSEQIRPWDILACCWELSNQPKKQRSLLPRASSPSSSCLSMSTYMLYVSVWSLEEHAGPTLLWFRWSTATGLKYLLIKLVMEACSVFLSFFKSFFWRTTKHQLHVKLLCFLFVLFEIPAWFWRGRHFRTSWQIYFLSEGFGEQRPFREYAKQNFVGWFVCLFSFLLVCFVFAFLS